MVNLQLEARDGDGETAFVAAYGTGDPECIAELIKAGGVTLRPRTTRAALKHII